MLKCKYYLEGLHLSRVKIEDMNNLDYIGDDYIVAVKLGRYWLLELIG